MKKLKNKKKSNCTYTKKRKNIMFRILESKINDNKNIKNDNYDNCCQIECKKKK